MPHMTELAIQTAGKYRFNIHVTRTLHGWELRMVAAPVAPQLPDFECDTEAYIAYIESQAKPLATDRTARFYVGEREVRPTEAAMLMVRRVLGSGWTVRDLGKGYAVEVRS